ncbi:response regulator transcription factor [Kutzneria buriramensis]|uniref:Two-component system phosphate regulon response regulator PhoB/two-component system response regulator AdeR n=1 Tax=Kutzneria buriramensis TaxID=1045776 RepID=A0A3E0GZZ4_9PSEU|nr:response regulator transcription factor [Kutzneria buriramensis]REH34934.1 two-component system phosphate regulon response regulator PhoB/two-component system response regulator AdeR [Kutzneria buriramensis]
MDAAPPPDGQSIDDRRPYEPLNTEFARPVVAFVEDEADLVAMAESYLRRDGFRVVTAVDARSAATVLSEHDPDLMVLDLGLPDGNGLDLLREVRAGRHLPVIILTGWSSERERVVGLELGADDYVVKPFSLPELAARIRAVLRRSRSSRAPAVIRHGGLAIDTDSHEVTANGHPVKLTPLEYRLLLHLAAAPRRVFTAAQLLTAAWGWASERQDPSSVVEHVYRLRRKLTEAGVDRPRIVTVRGAGYRLDP